MPARPHSLEHLGPARKFWWDLNFIHLMGLRWGLDDVRSVLDVGCGVGHWSATLGAVLPDDATLVGIDPEPEWIRIASEVNRRAGKGDRCRFQLGRAESLEFPDASFDLVTCQTLLIHLASPRAAIEEMKRVLKPGGKVVLVEPSNLVQALCRTSTRLAESVEDTMARVRFNVLCERGRASLGEGDYSIGDLLPGMLADLGFEAISVFQSDRPHGMWGQYDSEEQNLVARSVEGDVDPRVAACVPWEPDDARRYFLAAGGTDEEFEDCVSRLAAQSARTREDVRNRAFYRSGGVMRYLISATRPLS